MEPRQQLPAVVPAQASPKPNAGSDDPCSEVKAAYERAFRAWFTNEFVSGKSPHQSVAGTPGCCEQEWLAYRACVDHALLTNGLAAKVQAFEERVKRKSS